MGNILSKIDEENGWGGNPLPPQRESRPALTRHNSSAADWCRHNGWGPGTIIEGDEGNGPERILITAVGEHSILARSLKYITHGERKWSLCWRDWKKVS